MADIGSNAECCYPLVAKKDSTTGDNDQLLQIFPSEVWLQVFNYLQDSEDLIRVSNASPVFAELLRHKRLVYFFPTVWNIVGVKLTEGAWEGQAPTATGSTAEGNNNEREQTSGILMLRLVTRSWKDAIDQFYCFNALPRDFAAIDKKYQNAEKLESLRWARNDFSVETSSLTKCLAHFEATHQNGKSEFSPFLDRQVSISVPSRRAVFLSHSLVAFEQSILGLLEAYGHHIWKCEIKYAHDSVTPQKASNLRKWISLLPNLVSLTITGLDDYYISDRLERGLLRALKPLPKLEKLQHLSIFKMVPVVGNRIIKNYNHVSILRLRSGAESPHFEITKIAFPNLGNLVCSFGSFGDFRKLETTQCSSSFWKLEVTFKHAAIPPLPEIFALLARKWATSLKVLKIRCTQTATDWEGVETEIQQLKRQYFPDLEELVWRVDRRSPVRL